MMVVREPLGVSLPRPTMTRRDERPCCCDALSFFARCALAPTPKSVAAASTTNAASDAAYAAVRVLLRFRWEEFWGMARDPWDMSYYLAGAFGGHYAIRRGACHPNNFPPTAH